MEYRKAEKQSESRFQSVDRCGALQTAAALHSVDGAAGDELLPATGSDRKGARRHQHDQQVPQQTQHEPQRRPATLRPLRRRLSCQL